MDKCSGGVPSYLRYQWAKRNIYTASLSLLTAGIRSTHYDTLELQSNCKSDEIRCAYLRLSKKYHPDLNHGSDERTTRKFQEINEAYSVLSQPEKRNQYDAQLLSRSSHSSYDAQARRYEDARDYYASNYARNYQRHHYERNFDEWIKYHNKQYSEQPQPPYGVGNGAVFAVIVLFFGTVMQLAGMTRRSYDLDERLKVAGNEYAKLKLELASLSPEEKRKRMTDQLLTKEPQDVSVPGDA